MPLLNVEARIMLEKWFRICPAPMRLASWEGFVTVTLSGYGFVCACVCVCTAVGNACLVKTHTISLHCMNFTVFSCLLRP